MTHQVYLVEDHVMVRDMMKQVLESDPEIRVVGAAGDGRTAVAEVLKLPVDVVLMDIAMPELNGIEAAKQIRDANKNVKILIVSMHSTSEYVYRAFQAGVNGYLLKEEASDLIQVVKRVAAGERLLSGKIAEQVDMLEQPRIKASPLDALSMREREVLQLTVEGKSAESIAEILSLSAKTVETYRTRLKKKLGINDLPALVKFAIQHGVTVLR